MNGMIIKITNLINESHIMMEINPQDQLEDIFRAIREVWNIDESIFVLKRGNDLIRRGNTMDSYGICDGTELEILPNPMGQ